VTLHWNPREDEGYAGARVTRSSGLWQSESFTAQGGEWIDRDVEPGRTYRYRIALLREDGSEAPISRPAVVAVPLPGEPFVEIQAPASILRPPEGIPR
jgi:hypothetical protein